MKWFVESLDVNPTKAKLETQKNIMITERFVAPKNLYPRTSRSKERLIFILCLLVCVFFLYNNRQAHEVIVRHERSLSKLKTALIEKFDEGQRIDSLVRLGTNLTSKIQCSPRTNIAFLKTHRTGSSTVTNILNRYGDKHNLTFILPKKGRYRLGWPYLFSSHSYAPLHGKLPNILCNHARYNRQELDLIMPNNTIHVTIIRDPADQFDSVFEHFELGTILGINSSYPLGEFIEKPWFYLERALSVEMISALDFQRLQLTRNGMLFDLGLAPEEDDSEAKMRAHIKRIDKEFDLVMLNEYFNESMVLLKNLMCWTLDEVVYIALNKRLMNKKTNIDKYKQKIREWNSGDTLLYKYFNQTFWEKVRQYGSQFYDDVNKFRQKLDYLKDVCAHDDASSTHVTSLCDKMLTNETSYVEYLQKKQNIDL